MKQSHTTLILGSVNLTSNFLFEKIAVLDPGASLNEDGSLPKDKYGIYYRISSCEGEIDFSITDYSCGGLAKFETIAKFWLENSNERKEIE